MGTKFGTHSRWRDRFRKVGNEYSRVPASILVKHKTSIASLWIDGLRIPSWDYTELRGRALKHFHDDQTDIDSDIAGFIALLRACARDRDLCTGRRVHDHVLKHGLLKECSDALICMYAKCGALAMARNLLDTNGSQNVRTWTAIIAEYARKGQGQEALDCFDWMQHEGLSPDAVTFTCVLKACGSMGAVDIGEWIHDEIVKQGLLAKNVLLGNSLVAMYAKCGGLTKAYRVLENLPFQTASPWNALIAGFAEQGKGEEALGCFEQMRQKGLSPDAVTYTCALKACGSMGALGKGEEIHDEITGGLLGSNVVLDNTLVSMYAKCNALTKARQVLEEIPVRTAISWNALIAGYVQQGEAAQALRCFEQMQHEGISPNAVTFACILRACGYLSAVEMGEKIHEMIAKEGLLGHDIVLSTSLVDMYVKCGSLTKADHVLEELPVRNATCWNALIAGYVAQDESEQALSCFDKMRRENISPNALTFSHILKACGSIGAADRGVEIHDMIAKHGLLGHDMVLGTALVDMYAKCGALTKAQKVFEELPVKDSVSWSALIVGYVQNGKSEQALACFKKMQGNGLSPDAVTFICILKACGSLRAADWGAKIHEWIVDQGLLADKDVVLGTALLDMYAKCDALSKAREVFEDLPVRNVVTWNALISGYAEHGNCEEALQCFEKMQYQGLTPDAVTYLCVLKACGSIGAVERGKTIHDEIAKQGHWKNHIVLITALVDMYAKCGAVEKAQQVLEELPIRDSVSWNALMMGYIKKGEGKHAMDCFRQMQHDGLSPDAATFSCMLIACSRLGLVEEAHSYFVGMTTKFGVTPDIEHYTCMVDVFGRAGCLSKAVGLIQRMPFYNFDVWSTLLAACQKWGDVKIGRWAFEHAI